MSSESPAPLDPALIEALHGRRLLLLGFGREGRSSLAFIARHYEALGRPPLAIADQRPVERAGLDALVAGTAVEPDAIALTEGEGYLEAIADADYVFKSPGISLRDYTDAWAGPGRLARWPGAEIGGQIDLLLRFARPAALIGITGTKGKTTTSALVASICRAAGRDVHLIGNIGVPVLDHWEQIGPQSIAVVELSSHQLQFTTASPPSATITNFYEEHLDHYRGYDEYIEAKLNILRYQGPGDLFVLNGDDAELVRRARPLLRGRVIESGAAQGARYLGLNPALIGPHHAVDMALAAALAQSAGCTEEDVRRGIASFEGLRHRCELLGEYRGIRFYNDSIATIPAATRFAVESLAEVSSLIVGGMDRGLDFGDFIAWLAHSGVEHLICLPDTGRQIYAHFQERERSGAPAAHWAEDIEAAVALAYRLTTPGRICLLSPAASSYHRWRSFEERGDAFRDAVVGQAAEGERD